MKSILKESKSDVFSITLFVLRTVIGWHFLYEGIVKASAPSWSAYGYLLNSKWIFANFFVWIAETPSILRVVDILNVWGLVFIGLALMFGFFTRAAAIFGITLLGFYYLATPPFIGMDFGIPAEGHYLIVNKNLIELVALTIFLVIPPGKVYGFDRLWVLIKAQKKRLEPNATKVEKTLDRDEGLGRRELIKNLLPLPIFGGFVVASLKKKGWLSYEEQFLSGDTDAVSGATVTNVATTSLKELKGQIPKVKIGDLEVSRVIMGGNLIGGWAHARDLIYASRLVKAYHTDERVMQTLQLAERCGINSLLTNPALSRIVNKYWHETGGKIQFISDCGGSPTIKEGILASEKAGASAMYVHGGKTDFFVRDKKFDEIRDALKLIRSLGKPAGIGAHKLESIKACIENDIIPDFWMKTIHDHNYWSAQIDPLKKDVLEPDFKDNIFCFKPQETIDYMNQLDQPWIGFKILAAGAIQPREGIEYAFKGGADFIALGMYDFQIVEDANIVLEVLESDIIKTRQRRWLT
jgi:uncharacterized membrane protein YphA (DoxX/SURF4 family)